MSEVEKLYSLAGVEKKEYGYCDWDSNCPYPHHKCNNECPYWKIKKVDFPPFTAEKQIEIIKWLLDKTDLYLHRHKTDFTYSIASGSYAVNKYKDFKESIAEFMNIIWQDLTSAEQNEIRRILK